MRKFELNLNNIKVVLIVDLERDNWYLLIPEYGQYASGEINSHFERIHHPIRIVNRNYELVFDCDDDNTYWDSWSVWDCEQECYLSISGSLT